MAVEFTDSIGSEDSFEPVFFKNSFGAEDNIPPNVAPVGTPNPLNASLDELQLWSSTAQPRTITITDVNGDNFTVSQTVAPPDFVTVGGTAVIDGATSNASGVTIVFDGTPDATDGDTGPTVYNWSYTVTALTGDTTPVVLNVQLTVADTADPFTGTSLSKVVSTKSPVIGVSMGHNRKMWKA